MVSRGERTLKHFLCLFLTSMLGAACSSDVNFGSNSSTSKNNKNTQASGDVDPNSSSSDANGENFSGDGGAIDVKRLGDEDFFKQAADALALLCGEKENEIHEQTITFEEQTDTCPWGDDDNNPDNGNITPDIEQRISSRLEESIKLDLPPGALLCSMALDFKTEDSGSDRGQLMYYDDEIFLTLNSVILAASQSHDRYLEKKNNFLVYDWDKLLKQDYRQNFGVYCIGEEQGLGKCKIPRTQTRGLMSLSFDEKIIQEAALTALGVDAAKKKDNVSIVDPDFTFKFITTGDNNPDIDCQHSRFSFKVRTSYILNK